MEFTVFTSAGGFREFPGDSSYEVGEHNGCLYVVEGSSGQVITYGANAWSSVQEWQREGQIVPPAGESRHPALRNSNGVSLDELDLADRGLTTDAAIEDAEPTPPHQFDPLFDPLESFVEHTGR